MIARVRGVILASTSAGSSVYVSSTSANTGTQLCRIAPIIDPPAVHGDTMISLPGSGFSAPIHTCMDAVPELAVTACFAPCFAANASSNSTTFGPSPT